jgi:hypothetical protein
MPSFELQRRSMTAGSHGRPDSSAAPGDQEPYSLLRALHIKDSCPWRGTPEDEKLGMSLLCAKPLLRRYFSIANVHPLLSRSGIPDFERPQTGSQAFKDWRSGLLNRNSTFRVLLTARRATHNGNGIPLCATDAEAHPLELTNVNSYVCRELWYRLC